MLGNKQKKWLKEAQKAEKPFQLDILSSTDHRNVIASFLRTKISSKELKGLVSPDDTYFFPSTYFSQLISNNLSIKGVIDICDLIDETNLPGELLEYQIFLNVQKVEGFFDLIKRKFYTPAGSFVAIKQIVRRRPITDVKYILNKLYWSEEHLEAVLDLMVEKGQFIGFIDPIKKQLYNFSFLTFSSEEGQKQNIKFLIHFINTSFSTESQASVKDISSLIQLPVESCFDFLEKNRDEIPFVFSSDKSYLYPILDIISHILKDLYVYRKIPIEFWQKRLNVDRTGLIILLKKLNQTLGGTLTLRDFHVHSLKDWFENGIDVESLAKNLNLKTSSLLEQIYDLTKILNLRLVAGENSDPFLVKGIKDFDIFCQVDTSSYTNPHLYFECQNCKRVICTNCRSSGSKHECPFCGNISAFIIDLPRYCPNCRVNYTHSYNLVRTEECYFCKSGPLEIGWGEEETTTEEEILLDEEMINFLNKTKESTIPLIKIFSIINRSDADSILLLENYILKGKIQGTIDIHEMTLELKKEKEEFHCTICELQKSESRRISCAICNSTICENCYKKMNQVGVTLCPECGNNLSLFSP